MTTQPHPTYRRRHEMRVQLDEHRRATRAERELQQKEIVRQLKSSLDSQMQYVTDALRTEQAAADAVALGQTHKH